MEPYSFARYGAKDSSYRRLALDVGRMDLLYKLALADVNGTFDRPDDRALLQNFLQRTQELAIKDAKPKPILLGRHLIALGIETGPQMGKLLNQAFDAQIEGAFDDEPGAILWAKEHLLPPAAGGTLQ